MVKALILDLDGTMYYGSEAVPGAAGFVRRMRGRGVRCLFVTNRANRRPEAIAEHLSGYGIACELNDVLTSAQATAGCLEPGTAYCIGEEGLIHALTEAGFSMAASDADYVIVSFDRGFNYGKLERACRLIHAGARFVATNPDRAMKMPDGMVPGTGAIVAAVEAGSGQSATCIGKPEPRIFEMALRKLGMQAADVVAVGDNVLTDIPAGVRAGMRTALILTGVSTREDAAAAAYTPTWVVENYAELEHVLDEG